jgi:thioredoxin 1
MQISKNLVEGKKRGKRMMNSSNDLELKRIQRKKIVEMLQQAKSAEKATGKPIILTDSNFFSEVSTHSLLVVDFWAPWCGACRMVGPLLEQLAIDYAGKVAFGKMNVDENQTVPSRFGVLSIPTLVVLKNGIAVETIIGACSRSHIESKFKPFMKKDQ